MSVSIILLDTDQTPDGDNNLAQFQKVHSVTYGRKGLVEPLTSQGQEAEGEQTGNQVESQSPILSGLHPPKFPQPPQIMPRACEGHFIFSSRGCAYVESAQRVIQGVPHRHGGSGELRMVHQSNMVLLAEPQACANVLGQSGKGEACPCTGETGKGLWGGVWRGPLRPHQQARIPNLFTEQSRA